MGKSKRDLLKKKLIAQQMAQGAASYQTTSVKTATGAAAVTMPIQALKSKASGINTGEYSFVLRDVKKTVFLLAFVIIAFIVIYIADQKTQFLTRLANFVFDKLI